MTDSLKPPTLLYLLSTSLQSQKKSYLPSKSIPVFLQVSLLLVVFFFYFTLVKIWIITEMHKITNFDYKNLLFPIASYSFCRFYMDTYISFSYLWIFFLNSVKVSIVFDLLFSPWKIRTEWSLMPGNSTKLCHTNWNFKDQKRRPMGFFLDHL